MPRYSGPWDEAAVAAYLDAARIPVRIATRTPGGGLWMLSLWFRREDDALLCATSASADVVAYLDADPEVAFEVSDNDPPYRGVRGNGTATVTPDPEKDVLRSLLDRYLGGTDTPLGRRLLGGDREEVQIRIDPERIHSWDYSDRMADEG
jgi:nitroimidazol reductase NimA-like FMN-containing flavoprotein (pyridoxamine 5'-phosphate oxidase superfamily)